MSENAKTYSERLRDPRWQKKRLEILQRDEWHCRICFDGGSTLVVHHRFYERGREPWDYPDYALVTLCESCHQDQHDSQIWSEQILARTIRKVGGFNTEIGMLSNAFQTAEGLTLNESDWWLINIAIHRCIRSIKKWDEFGKELKKWGDENPEFWRRES